MLTKVVDTMSLTEDNLLLNLLIEAVATIPLDTIEFGRLSIAALQFIQMENNFIAHRYKIAEELEPLIEFINFRRIKGRILANIIEPLKIIPDEIILNVIDPTIQI